MNENGSNANKKLRYSAEKKAEVINFIKEFNSQNKRGGQKVAAEKFNITPITLSNWMKKEKAAVKPRKAYTKSEKPVMSSSEYASIFSRLAEVHAQIDMLEKQVERLEELRVQADELRKSLTR